MLRPLGTTNILITPVAFGAWPISGMTSGPVTDADSIATIQAALGEGINFIDTAYCYGETGESERLIAKAIAGRRNAAVIATKGGVHWEPGRQQKVDGRPATLRRQCDESLRRLATDRVELLYLHAPDPTLDIAESAGELKRLLDEGKTRSVGASNVSLAQLEKFAAECPLSAYQPPYNMLQREIEADTLPWCRAHDVSVLVYWPLMKGLLSGKYARDHQFDPTDSRLKYPMFQGDEWQKNQDFLDELRAIAADCNRTVSQIVVNWTIHRPGITAALCGAKTPDQIIDTAAAMGWQLPPEHTERIERAIAKRGKVLTKAPV